MALSPDNETTLSGQALPSVAQIGANVKTESLWVSTLRRLARQRNAIVGAFILLTLVLAAILAPVIAPYDPIQSLIGVEDIRRRDKPCVHALGCDLERPQHIMGIDGNGRDQFSRIIYGSRYSLFIGFTTVSFAIIIGTILGAIAGYAGGIAEDIIMRFMDVLLAFPSLLLAIAIVAVLGPGLQNTLLAVGIVTIPQYARIVRGSVLSVKEQEFVEASRALGASNFHILRKRILPNSLTPLIVAATLGIATAILDAAALSFLGFGAQPPAPEWGAMRGTERGQIFSAPHLVFFPGIAISVTVLAFNLLGDGLRDALDPRLKGR